LGGWLEHISYAEQALGPIRDTSIDYFSPPVESYLIGRSGNEKLHRFKGEWSPKIAKDLYYLLSKKRIE